LLIGLLLALSLLAFGGCGDGRVKRYPVTCTVNVDGKPAHGVMVIFCPIEGPPELLRERPVAVSGADGKFQLTTFGGNDGTPAGKFKVLAQWPTNKNPNPDPAGGPAALGNGPDRLHGKYFNLDKTPLTATIEPDTKELPTFELRSK
jgi:hypothetical protein